MEGVTKAERINVNAVEISEKETFNYLVFVKHQMVTYLKTEKLAT